MEEIEGEDFDVESVGSEVLVRSTVSASPAFFESVLRRDIKPSSSSVVDRVRLPLSSGKGTGETVLAFVGRLCLGLLRAVLFPVAAVIKPDVSLEEISDSKRSVVLEDSELVMDESEELDLSVLVTLDLLPNVIQTKIMLLP